MPKIRWTNLPPSLREHLFDRVAERQIPAEDLYKLKLWRESEPEALTAPGRKISDRSRFVAKVSSQDVPLERTGRKREVTVDESSSRNRTKQEQERRTNRKRGTACQRTSFPRDQRVPGHGRLALITHKDAGSNPAPATDRPTAFAQGPAAEEPAEWHRTVAPGVEVGVITTHGLALSRPRRGFESRWGHQISVAEFV